jgi:hypothetical protein
MTETARARTDMEEIIAALKKSREVALSYFGVTGKGEHAIVFQEIEIAISKAEVLLKWL